MNLSEEDKANIQRAVNYAHQHPIQIAEALAGRSPLPGFDPQHWCDIAGRWRICFSVEIHPPGAPTTRALHLSVSKVKPKHTGDFVKWELIGALAPYFGFTQPLAKLVKEPSTIRKMSRHVYEFT